MQTKLVLDKKCDVLYNGYTGGKPRPLKGPPSHILKNTFIVRNSDSIGRNN
eukprot:UN25059